MNSEWFEKVIKEQIKTCEDVLIGKAKEYATDDDRLHNFKNAAGMMSCDPKEALAGMMAKHTISVYDMCRSWKDYPIELWNEKITDHINYLLLLKAIVEEDHWYETLGNEGEKYPDQARNTQDQDVSSEDEKKKYSEEVIQLYKDACACISASCDQCSRDKPGCQWPVCELQLKADLGRALNLDKEIKNVPMRCYKPAETKEEHHDDT